MCRDLRHLEHTSIQCCFRIALRDTSRCESGESAALARRDRIFRRAILAELEQVVQSVGCHASLDMSTRDAFAHVRLAPLPRLRAWAPPPSVRQQGKASQKQDTPQVMRRFTTHRHRCTTNDTYKMRTHDTHIYELSQDKNTRCTRMRYTYSSTHTSIYNIRESIDMYITVDTFEDG